MTNPITPHTNFLPSTRKDLKNGSIIKDFFENRTYLNLTLQFLSSHELVKIKLVNKLFKLSVVEAMEMQVKSQTKLKFKDLLAFAQFKSQRKQIDSLQDLSTYLPRLNELDYSEWPFGHPASYLLKTLPYKRMQQITSLNFTKTHVGINILKMLLVGVPVYEDTDLEQDLSPKFLLPNLKFLNLVFTGSFWEPEELIKAGLFFKNGRGTFISSQGERLEGQWKEGKLHGKGKLLSHDVQMMGAAIPHLRRSFIFNIQTYEGQFHYGIKQGQGTSTDELDGSRYEGHWQDGWQHGHGIRILPDGTRYEGDWEKNKRHGKGINVYPDKTIYDGQWREDKKHGRGIFTYSDGSTYEGDWQNGERQGQGERRSKSGRLLYTGGWDKHLKHGEGHAWYRDGSSYAGKWHKNKWQGQGVYIDSTGRRSEGSWLEDDKGNRYMHFPMDAKF